MCVSAGFVVCAVGLINWEGMLARGSLFVWVGWGTLLPNGVKVAV